MTAYLDRLGGSDISPIVASLIRNGESHFVGSPGATYSIGSTLDLTADVLFDLRGGVLLASHADTTSSIRMGPRALLKAGSYVGPEPVGTAAPPANSVVTGKYGVEVLGDKASIDLMVFADRTTPVFVDGADGVHISRVDATGLVNAVAEWNSHALIAGRNCNRLDVSGLEGVDFGTLLSVDGGNDHNIRRVIGSESAPGFNKDNCVYINEGSRATVSDVWANGSFDNAVKVRGDYATIENIRADEQTSICVAFAVSNEAQPDGYGARGTTITGIKSDGCPQGAVNFRADPTKQFAHQGVHISDVWARGFNPSSGRAAIFGWAEDVHITDVNVEQGLGHIVRIVGENDGTVDRGKRVTVRDININDATGTVEALIHFANLQHVTADNIHHTGGGPTELLQLVNCQHGSYTNMSSPTGKIDEDANCDDNLFADMRITGTNSLLGTNRRSLTSL